MLEAFAVSASAPMRRGQQILIQRRRTMARRLSRREFLHSLSLGAGLVVLAACGGTAATPAAPTAAPQAAAPTAAPAARAKSGAGAVQPDDRRRQLPRYHRMELDQPVEHSRRPSKNAQRWRDHPAQRPRRP